MQLNVFNRGRKTLSAITEATQSVVAPMAKKATYLLCLVAMVNVEFAGLSGSPVDATRSRATDSALITLRCNHVLVPFLGETVQSFTTSMSLSCALEPRSCSGSFAFVTATRSVEPCRVFTGTVPRKLVGRLDLSATSTPLLARRTVNEDGFRGSWSVASATSARAMRYEQAVLVFPQVKESQGQRPPAFGTFDIHGVTLPYVRM